MLSSMVVHRRGPPSRAAFRKEVYSAQSCLYATSTTCQRWWTHLFVCYINDMPEVVDSPVCMLHQRHARGGGLTCLYATSTTCQRWWTHLFVCYINHMPEVVDSPVCMLHQRHARGGGLTCLYATSTTCQRWWTHLFTRLQMTPQFTDKSSLSLTKRYYRQI